VETVVTAEAAKALMMEVTTAEVRVTAKMIAAMVRATATGSEAKAATTEVATRARLEIPNAVAIAVGEAAEQE
jgi:hypothetical protein